MKLKPGVMLVISIMTISILLCGRSKTFAQSPSPPESFKLWPSGAPGAVGNEPVDAPTLTPYLPKENATGAAVIDCPGGGYTHLADNPSKDLITLLSNEEQVTKQTPPTFLVHTANDAAVPVENSLHFAEALRKIGVPFELHIYERGPHGFGLGGNNPVLMSWQASCANWLKLNGF